MASFKNYFIKSCQYVNIYLSLLRFQISVSLIHLKKHRTNIKK